jgi:cobalt-zinc-cadmium efflux system outer membrane protein
MKSDISKTLAVILFVISPVTILLGESSEQREPNQFLTINDYLKYAEAHNADLQGSFEQWNAAKERIGQAKSLENPTLTYGYATERTPTRSVFEVMQPFPWFGTIEARTDLAKAFEQSARQQYEAKKHEVRYELKDAFYQYCYLAHAIEITKENIELFRHFEQVAQTRYATSLTSNPDVIRAQIELAKLEDTLKSFEKSRPVIIAKLNSILNRPALSDLPWPVAASYKRISLNGETLQELVSKSNFELKELAYNIEAARYNEKLAEKKFYPDFGLGVSIDAGMGNNGKTRVMPLISATLPIWRGNLEAGQRQTQSQIRQAQDEKNQKENVLTARAQQVLFEFEDSSRKIALYGDTIIPKAREMIAASESAYQSGTIDFLSLTDAQRTLLDYRLNYEQAVTENFKRLAELELLTGTELEMN